MTWILPYFFPVIPLTKLKQPNPDMVILKFNQIPEIINKDKNKISFPAEICV
jgi:hypothetical protein